MNPPTDNKPPAPAGKMGANVSPHLKNLRNFVEQFIVERDGLTGETALRVADNMPVTCDEMSMMLLAVNLAERERTDLLAANRALREALEEAKRCLGHPDNIALIDAALALSRATGSAGQEGVT